MKLKIEIGDKVVVNPASNVFRPGREAKVIAIRPRPLEDPLIVVEWSDLPFPSTYAARFLLTPAWS